MSHHAIARILLASFCVAQGAATLVIDLNRTHASNPAWLGHARFHLVWQAATTAALSAVEVALLVIGGPWRQERFYIAALLAALPVCGFFAALFTRKLYGGTLYDANGIRPVKLRLRGSVLQFDMNLVVEVFAVATLAGIVAIYRSL